MSRSSNIILDLLKMARARQRVLRFFMNPPRDTGSLDPRKIKRSLQPEAWTVDGHQLLTIQGEYPSPKHVIYLPGGAYLLEATPAHRQFAEKLVKISGLSITLINYPKSPEHTYRTTHQLVEESYHHLLAKYPDQEFCLLGDSAGGGLALAFLQSLRDQMTVPLPGKTVLISPWLDLSLSHPDIPAYVSRDLILPMEGLNHAASLYAGGADLRDPLLSPIYGNLKNLGDIKLIFGTEEVFYPDCRALVEKIGKVQGTQLDWEVGENLIHAWPIFPFPQSRAAISDIANFLLAD